MIHLATHGYLNEARAMSSGLLLSAPEAEPAVGETGEDGVLQAWEIYSQVRLGVTPEINAVSTILVAFVALGVLAASVWGKARALARLP